MERIKLRRGEAWQDAKNEAGGYCFGDSSSSSESSQTTTTTNVDRRQVVGEGAIGLASDSSTVSITNNSIDAGVVNKALDVVGQNDAVNGEGFTKLLTLADKLFTGAGAVVEKTQDTALAQISALNTAANDSRGDIDQKTVMVVAGIAAAAFIFRKKGAH